MKVRERLSASLGACIVIAAPSAFAGQITFDFTYSGATLPSWYSAPSGQFGSGLPRNSARATGSITFDDSTALDSGIIGMGSGSAITSFVLTVSGASAGNGTFTSADYSDFAGLVNTATGFVGLGQGLDLTRELVGQATAFTPWGTPQDRSSSNSASWPNPSGDLGFARTSAGSGAQAPFQEYFYTLETAGGQAMVLTSFTPVPLPAPAWQLLSALGGLGVLSRMRLRDPADRRLAA
jgi:hypothetical protein